MVYAKIRESFIENKTHKIIRYLRLNESISPGQKTGRCYPVDFAVFEDHRVKNITKRK